MLDTFCDFAGLLRLGVLDLVQAESVHQVEQVGGGEGVGDGRVPVALDSAARFLLAGSGARV